MIDFVTLGMIDPDRPVPINIQQLVQILRMQNSPFARNLTDALTQLEQAIQLIWSILQSPDEVLIDNLQVKNASGEVTTTVSDTGISVVSGGTGTKSSTLNAGSLTVKDDATGTTGKVELTVVGDDLVLKFTRNGTEVGRWEFASTGITLSMLTGALVTIGGNRVLTDRQPAVTAVSSTVPQTAGATYTATEQAMLNALKTLAQDNKTAINTLISRLQTMGILS